MTLNRDQVTRMFLILALGNLACYAWGLAAHDHVFAALNAGVSFLCYRRYCQLKSLPTPVEEPQ